MSNVKTIAKNTVFLLSGDVLGKILSFFLILAIARYLGDIGLGKYAFIFAFVDFMMVFSDFGITTLAVREIARDRSKSGKFFGSLLTFKIAVTAMIFFVFIAIISIIEKTSEIRTAVFIAALAYFFYILKDFVISLFQAYEKMQYFAFVNTLERVITVSLGILVLLKGYGVIAITVVFLVSYIITFMVSIYLARAKIAKIWFSWNWKIIVKSLAKSLPFWFTLIFSALYFRIDTVMIRMISGFDAAGWYNASFKLVEALSFIPGAMVIAVFPAMSRFHMHNKKYLKMLYKKSFYYLFVLALPIGIGTTMLSARIIPFIYGSQFFNSIFALQILVWAEVFLFLSWLCGFLLNSINKQKLFTITAAICAMLNILLNLFLIPTYSYIGASIATVITQFIALAFLFYFAVKSGYRINVVKTVCKPLIAGIIMGFVVFKLSFLHFLLIVPIGAAVYFLALFLAGGISADEFNIVKQLLSIDKK